MKPQKNNFLTKMPTTLKGIPASPGIAIGKALSLDTEDFNIPRKEISDKELPQEIARFEEALIQTRSEIMEIQEKISKEMGSAHAEIFSAHLLVLEDRMLIEEVITRLKKEKLSVEYVFLEVLKKYVKAFYRVDDEYLKERVSDIDDVGKRILRNLLGRQRRNLMDLKEKIIVVAYDLSPSDTAMMHKKNVIGFVTDIGGRTSHTAIMAKSLELPAIVGLELATQKIQSGDTLILDGNRGEVHINPDKSILKKYEDLQHRFAIFEKEILKSKDLPAVTLDGHKLEVAANIELPEEIPSVIAHGAFGIGLYRTEYFYLNRKDLPLEEEQFQAYKKVATQMGSRPVVIRTMDLGGDKFLSQLQVPHQMNPFLGWRAIRFSLARPDIFKVQLRAILRASVYGKLKIMYPMISGLDELRQANKVLEEAEEELKQKRLSFDKDIEVGAMIEIPSAALTCDLLAKEVDFFSIGTNDLIQYALAVDRSNEKIAYLYEPTHPAVLRLIKNVIDTGHQNNIWVGMCGEMAGEKSLAILLLGMGLDEFSTSPALVPEIKIIIRSITLEQAKAVAEKSLTLATGKEVEEFAKRKLKELVPNIGE